MTYNVVVEPGFWDKLTAVGTVVAFVAVTITLLFSVRGQRDTHAAQKLIAAGRAQEERLAKSTAARAEAAARLSADYSGTHRRNLEAIARSALAGWL